MHVLGVLLNSLEICHNFIGAAPLYTRMGPFIKCIMRNNAPPIKDINRIEMVTSSLTLRVNTLCTMFTHYGKGHIYRAPFNQLMTCYYPYEHNS